MAASIPLAAEGSTTQEVGPGDVVWIPPNVRHWHGTTADQPMTRSGS